MPPPPTARPIPTSPESCCHTRAGSSVPLEAWTTTPKPLADYPELMTVAEVARYLRIATSTAYLLTRPGPHPRRLPAVKVGGRTFILRDRLADYLQPQR